MSHREELSAKLVSVLSGIEFDKQYYAYALRNPTKGGAPYKPARKQLESALEACGLKARYMPRERFFQHRETHEVGTIELNVLFTGAGLECILAMRSSCGYIGGPFSLLARRVAESRGEKPRFDPPFPQLPLHDLAELREAVKFGARLFEEAVSAILSCDGWPLLEE